ncbi:dnaJ homolog subfamily C member 10-like isoform X2 [Epargyreus clarus]|uniref:dnaJ homolog subfamily C member 10-like isoform X2 n=1 Tax=Epargyreus clarus TaxID=520877 RepID=UPI003C3078FD
MIKIILACLVIVKSANLSDLSYYEILGVEKQATKQEIKQAYKKLAVKLHPDKNSNKEEQEKFLRITEAYETLRDTYQRYNYDQQGSQSSYTRKYDYRSQRDYNNLYYNGLYHDDPFVDTVSGSNFFTYLSEGFHFMNFYSPFCPPCQNLVEHWKRLAEVYKGIVKVAAINCKHHNSFCYNSMRITSYPSLLFYPNGKKGNYVVYRGGHNFEALETFVITYIGKQIHIPTLWQLRNVDKPMAYVVDDRNIDDNSLIRITFHLKGIVPVVLVDDNDMRSKLTSDPDAVIVFKSKGITKEIHSTDEKTIIREIIKGLPKVEQLDRQKLKQIISELRGEATVPWALYFTTKDDDKLSLYQMRNEFPEYNFGEVDCDSLQSLCESLAVESPPAWGALKRGGRYQRAPRPPRDFLRRAAHAARLRTVSHDDLSPILDGRAGAWVLLVVPHQIPWDHLADAFTEASLHFLDDDIDFGIMACTATTNQHCKQVARNQAVVLVQNGTTRHVYNGRMDHHDLMEFIQLLKDTSNIELTEQQALEIMDVSSREHAWLVAYLPDNCGTFCEEFTHEWRLVAKKLRALSFLRVGFLQCGRETTGLCRNVRLPTGRLYPLHSGQHYTVNLQHVSQAPYILEWALERIDDSVNKLNWQTFTKTVLSEELSPTRNKKPWLVYFHSPRCYRCYELYPDFAIISILLANSINFGKVNCISDRGLCQQEHINSYPSIKLYVNNQRGKSAVALQAKEYASLLQDIRPHLKQYDENLLASIDDLVAPRSHFQHDEL